MMSVHGRGLHQRLGWLEDQVWEQTVHQEAERVAALVDAPADVLLARAVEIAGLIERHGRDRAIELVAHGVGRSAESLESRAAQLERRSD